MVYASHCVTSILGRVMASDGKVAKQPNGFCHHHGIRNLERYLSRPRIHRGLAFSQAADGCISHSSGFDPYNFSNTVTDCGAPLRDRLLSRNFGSRRIGMVATCEGRIPSRRLVLSISYGTIYAIVAASCCNRREGQRCENQVRLRWYLFLQWPDSVLVYCMRKMR